MYNHAKRDNDGESCFFFLWKLKPFKGKVEEDLQTKQEIKKKNSRK
jgi:hypothetical protein